MDYNTLDQMKIKLKIPEEEANLHSVFEDQNARWSKAKAVLVSIAPLQITIKLIN